MHFSVRACLYMFFFWGGGGGGRDLAAGEISRQGFVTGHVSHYEVCGVVPGLNGGQFHLPLQAVRLCSSSAGLYIYLCKLWDCAVLALGYTFTSASCEMVQFWCWAMQAHGVCNRQSADMSKVYMCLCVCVFTD